MIDNDFTTVAPGVRDPLDNPLAGASARTDDAGPEGVPDALWRPLTDEERALVRNLPGVAQSAPAAGEPLAIALAPGLRAARTSADVLLDVQLQGADGRWNPAVANGGTAVKAGAAGDGVQAPAADPVPGVAGEAQGGRLLVSDLPALQVAYGRPLPAAVEQSPTALPAPVRPAAQVAHPAIHAAARRTAHHVASHRTHPSSHATPHPAWHRGAHGAHPAAAAAGAATGEARAKTSVPPAPTAQEPGLVERLVQAVESLFAPAAAAPAPAPGPAVGQAAPAVGHLVSARALSEMEVTHRGAAYRESQVVRWSHYDNAIVRTAGRPAGNSRIWGDAPAATQAAAIDALVRAARAAGLDNHDTALVLAIAHTESGFNPDAAAGTTSASGLGQFVDATARHYGLGNANRWDVDAQAKALVAHFVDNRALAHARHQGDAYIYKYHHDGPSRDYGGLAISERKVMPLAARYEALLDASHRLP